MAEETEGHACGGPEHGVIEELERSLRQCLSALDELGLSRSAAQLDLAIRQLHKDAASMRAAPPAG